MNEECRMKNAKCEMQNAKKSLGMQNAKLRLKFENVISD